MAAGDYDQAERLFTDATERSTRAGFVEGRAEQLGNPANVNFYVGRYADAGRLYRDALALTATAGDAAWVPGAAVCCVPIRPRSTNASAAIRRRSPFTGISIRAPACARANTRCLLVNLRRALTAVSAIRSERCPPTTRPRAEFARDHDVDGELNTVKTAASCSRSICPGSMRPNGSFSAAIDTATKIGNRREMLHSRLYRGETRLRSDHRDDARDDFSAGPALARELKTPEEEWKALYGLGRLAPDRGQAVSYLQTAVATIEQVREGIRVPSLRTEFLNDKREVHDALIAASLPSADTDALFGMLERSHSRGWRERLRLDTPIDLAGVRRALPARTPTRRLLARAAGGRGRRGDGDPGGDLSSPRRRIAAADARRRAGRRAFGQVAAGSERGRRANSSAGRLVSMVSTTSSSCLMARSRSHRSTCCRWGRSCWWNVPRSATFRRPRRCCGPRRLHAGCRLGNRQFQGFADPVDTANEFDAETAADRLTARRRRKCGTPPASLAVARSCTSAQTTAKHTCSEAVDRAPILPSRHARVRRHGRFGAVPHRLLAAGPVGIESRLSLPEGSVTR